jgi:hypothetical protein
MKLLITVCVLFILPWNLTATEQCPPGTKCEVPIEAKVTFLAMAEAIHKPCINLDTNNKELYQEAYLLLEERFGKVARAHEKYNEAQTYYSELFADMPSKRLRRECRFMEKILEEAEDL